MRKNILITLFAVAACICSCEKDKTTDKDVYGDGPSGNIPAPMQGNWMFGFFSMTEYWSQDPADYLGNAFEMAIAFTFHANGTYDHYFTSKTVSNGISTYHQSLTKGTLVIDETNRTITTYAKSAHYKQTKNGVTTENRELSANEITKITTYTYELRTEPNGTKAVYLKLAGGENALQFLQKF